MHQYLLVLWERGQWTVDTCTGERARKRDREASAGCCNEERATEDQRPAPVTLTLPAKIPPRTEVRTSFLTACESDDIIRPLPRDTLPYCTGRTWPGQYELACGVRSSPSRERGTHLGIIAPLIRSCPASGLSC